MLIVAAAMFVRAPFMIDDGAATSPRWALIQKIFYFHVPSADGHVPRPRSCAASPARCSSVRRSRLADHVAVAAAELAVVFGLIVLVTGPLWARKAWGVWWQWDVRLTMTLVMWMIFVAYLMLRRFGGPGSEILASAVGIFGTALVPFIYISVNYWRTLHPNTNVVRSLPPEMAEPFRWSMIAFMLLFVALLVVRIRLESGRATLEEAYVALED